MYIFALNMVDVTQVSSVLLHQHCNILNYKAMELNVIQKVSVLHQDI